MEIRHCIMEFACNMEEKLRIHDENKGRAGWVDMKPKKLLELLMGEILELSDVMIDPKYDSQKAISECADIANYSMMIVDIIKRRKNNE